MGDDERDWKTHPPHPDGNNRYLSDFPLQPGRRRRGIRVFKFALSGPDFSWCRFRRGTERGGCRRIMAEVAGTFGETGGSHGDHPQAVDGRADDTPGKVLPGQRATLRSAGKTNSSHDGGEWAEGNAP